MNLEDKMHTVDISCYTDLPLSSGFMLLPTDPIDSPPENEGKTLWAVIMASSSMHLRRRYDVQPEDKRPTQWSDQCT